MAEVVLSEIVVNVALKTIDLLIEEGKFLFGVEDQVKKLQGELKALGSFLKDANRRKYESDSLRTWVGEASLLAYRAEDIIEEYAIKVASRQGGGFNEVTKRVARIVGEGVSTHKVGNEIEKIKNDIESLKNNLISYGINRIIEAPPIPATIEQQRRKRTTYAHQVDEYFVGMEDDVSKIVTWVTGKHKIRRLISICGMGGLGKTTIARKVYNHRRVQTLFECFAWVTVTQQCQVKMLLQNILIQILEYKDQDERRKVRDMTEEDLVPMLNDVLKNKKCFVVLDDIWKRDDWESLCPALRTSEGSSKILLTTRIRKVAEVGHLQHEPALLDEKDGLDLLMKIALSLREEQANEFSKTVASVGRDILRKCDGLPLAIAVLGGILRGKHTLIGWETVNNKFETHVREKGGIVEVLAFSYDDLPSYLRPCFLYMGCFREDEDIDVTRLYQLWMADGLIPSMDVGSDFLEELISRNMVQPQLVRNGATNRISCRLHDLVRELCLTKGIDEEFPKIQICDERVDTEVKFPGIDKSTTNNTYIRALIIFKYQRQEFSFQGAMKFERLRSLILDNCKFKDNKLPEEIRDMIHLRCLSLQNSLSSSLRYAKLPSFIGELQYLQTLNLANNFKLQLPNIFHKMKRLRCLYISSDWPIASGSGTIRKFPRYEPQFWPDLVNLTLKDTYLEEDPMPFLQELPNLRELILHRKAYVGKEMYCSSKAFPKLTELEIVCSWSIEIWGVDAGAFPKLTELKIDRLFNIEIWRVDAGAFPNLSTLHIWECKPFEIVPNGLTSIASLTWIDIQYMPEEFSIKYEYGRVQNPNQWIEHIIRIKNAFSSTNKYFS